MLPDGQIFRENQTYHRDEKPDIGGDGKDLTEKATADGVEYALHR